MTVYVDDLFDYGTPTEKWRGGMWCHMWTDGAIQELHVMADKIGLKREWFQNKNHRFWHYDLKRSKRPKAIDNGAVYITLRDYLAYKRPYINVLWEIEAYESFTLSEMSKQNGKQESDTQTESSPGQRTHTKRGRL